MTAIGRLFQRVLAALSCVTVLAVAGHNAPIPAEQEWAGKLREIERVALARKSGGVRVAAQAAPAPARVAAVQAAPIKAAAVGDNVLSLAALHNKHVKTKFSFLANGWKLFATAGIDPANPEGSFLVLQVENKGAIVFDILSVLNDYKRPRYFAVNGQLLILKGEPTFWNSERDSVVRFLKNKKSMEEPEEGDSLASFSVIELKKELWSLGTPLNLGDEEYRVFYGDAVTKGEKRLQLGPGKGYAFVKKIKDDEFARPYLIDAAKVEVGRPVTFVLSKDTTVRMERTDEDTLKIAKENK